MDEFLSSKILHPTSYLQTHHSQSLPHINFLETKYNVILLYKSLYVGGGIKHVGSLGGGGTCEVCSLYACTSLFLITLCLHNIINMTRVYA